MVGISLGGAASAGDTRRSVVARSSATPSGDWNEPYPSRIPRVRGGAGVAGPFHCLGHGVRAAADGDVLLSRSPDHLPYGRSDPPGSEHQRFPDRHFAGCRVRLVLRGVRLTDGLAGRSLPAAVGGLLGRHQLVLGDGGLRPLQQLLAPTDRAVWRRSEEHTSELQSLMRTSYAVFCLKKKNLITTNRHTA